MYKTISFCKNKNLFKLDSFLCDTFLLPSLCVSPVTVIPSRNTTILKRKFPLRLYKEGNKPRFGKGSFFYELVEKTECNPEPEVDVILTSYVSGIGNPGDIISLKKSKAYSKLILPGLADFVTQESLEFSKRVKKDQISQEKLVTPTEGVCLDYLSNRTISIVMNKDTEWTVEPWHIKASFRKAGVHILSESSIELPPKPIKGPNLNLEEKIFYVTITVNKKHKVKVACRIHHWSTTPSERLPYVEEYWLKPLETVFPEDKVSETSESAASK